ncbi:expressed protein [Phakopsora pachyrhizi]|uniref:Expressed protein n=1 Tax=Phakopsora pachyrhizi TaxID=170000 RepID=A0AAV0BGF5_PHAPC|nr:expressed protein [Phakopsora pachyrhizi]
MPRLVNQTDVDSLPYHSLQAEAAKLSIRRNLGAAKLRIAIKRAFDDEGRTDNLPREWLTFSAFSSTPLSSSHSTTCSNPQPRLKNLLLPPEQGTKSLSLKRRLVSPREEEIKELKDEKKQSAQKSKVPTRRPFVPLPNRLLDDRTASAAVKISEEDDHDQIISDPQPVINFGKGDENQGSSDGSLQPNITKIQNDFKVIGSFSPHQKPSQVNLITSEKSHPSDDKHAEVFRSELFTAFEDEVRRMDLSGPVNSNTISSLVILTRQVLKSSTSGISFLNAVHDSLSALKSSSDHRFETKSCERVQELIYAKDLPSNLNSDNNRTDFYSKVSLLDPTHLASVQNFSRENSSISNVPPPHLRLISTPARPDIFQPPMVQTPNFSELHNVGLNKVNPIKAHGEASENSSESKQVIPTLYPREESKDQNEDLDKTSDYVSRKKIKFSDQGQKNECTSSESIEVSYLSQSTSTPHPSQHAYDSTTRSVLSPIDEDQEPGSSPHSDPIDGSPSSRAGNSLLESNNVDQTQKDSNLSQKEDHQEDFTNLLRPRSSTRNLKLFPDLRLNRAIESESRRKDISSKKFEAVKSPIGKVTLFGTENLYGDSTAEPFGEMDNYAFAQFLSTNSLK